MPDWTQIGDAVLVALPTIFSGVIALITFYRWILIPRFERSRTTRRICKEVIFQFEHISSSILDLKGECRVSSLTSSSTGTDPYYIMPKKLQRKIGTFFDGVVKRYNQMLRLASLAFAENIRGIAYAAFFSVQIGHRNSEWKIGGTEFPSVIDCITYAFTGTPRLGEVVPNIRRNSLARSCLQKGRIDYEDVQSYLRTAGSQIQKFLRNLSGLGPESYKKFLSNLEGKEIEEVSEFIYCRKETLEMIRAILVDLGRWQENLKVWYKPHKHLFCSKQ